MAKMNAVDWIARILVIIGALNWGLASFSSSINFSGVLGTIILALVGLSGIWEIIKLFQK
jgi:uncharacterized membrane protein YuzA (DUF378 family)